MEREREREKEKGMGKEAVGRREDTWEQNEVAFTKERLRRQNRASPFVVSLVKKAEVNRQEGSPLGHIFDEGVLARLHN